MTVAERAFEAWWEKEGFLWPDKADAWALFLAGYAAGAPVEAEDGELMDYSAAVATEWITSEQCRAELRRLGLAIVKAGS
jgi:hypothetical protein